MKRYVACDATKQFMFGKVHCARVAGHPADFHASASGNQFWPVNPNDSEENAYRDAVREDLS